MPKLTYEEEIELKKFAVAIRKNVLRMIRAGRAGHVGGAFSAADILTALYFKIMRVDPQKPDWPKRDRFVLSAGHKCLALYGTLAEKGFFEKSLLDTYGELCTKLGGHPDMHKLPGVETNTGALGHGLSIAGGMALGLRIDDFDAKVYVVMGDGELAEGSNWEKGCKVPPLIQFSFSSTCSSSAIASSVPINTNVFLLLIRSSGTRVRSMVQVPIT